MLGPPTTIYSTDTDDIQMNLLTQGHSQLVGEGGGGRGGIVGMSPRYLTA